MEAQTQKVIAVMTSGGDAPGMNAAVRGVYSRAKEYGYKVMGIRDGFTGLIHEDLFEMTDAFVACIIGRGGTELGTSRCEEFKETETQKLAADICRKYGISAVVVIGGDGSFQGALCLYHQGIGVVGIPGTIDLDIGCTEYTLGFDTAVNSAIDSIDKIMDSTRAHKCFSVVEVMGRRRGYIAMWCGIANSAAKIIVPEKQETIGEICEELKSKNLRGGLIVVAEGAGSAKEYAEAIEQNLGVHTRVDVLGFLQRGGNPTARDRVCGCKMGAYAVDMIRDERTCHIVAAKDGDLTATWIEDALREVRDLPEWLGKLGKTITG